MTVTSIGTTTPPAGYEYISDDIVSNLDHVVDQTVLKRVQHELVVADYPASSFFAEVWFEAGFFRCMVRRFHIHVETLQSESFDDLKEEICNRFGWS